MSARLLIVDDDAVRRSELEFRFSGRMEVRTAESARQALGMLAELRPGLVIASLPAAGGGGEDLVARVAADLPETAVLAIAVDGEAHTVVRALRAGAYDALAGPVDPDRLEDVVGRWRRERFGDAGESTATGVPPVGVVIAGELGMNELSGQDMSIPNPVDARWMQGAGGSPPVLRLELRGFSFAWDQAYPEEYTACWTPGEHHVRSGESRPRRDPGPAPSAPPALPLVVDAPDGRLRATVTGAAAVVEEPSTGWRREIAEPGLEDVAFSHDGQILLARQGGDVRMWRCDTGQEVARLPDLYCSILSVSPDAPLFATCGYGVVRAWRLDTALLLPPPPGAHPFEVFARGVGAWNAWRTRYPSVAPRLGAVNCSLRDLSGINLRGAGMPRAVLRRAALRHADLRGADLRFSDLRDADLRGARLAHADLSEALMAGAVLDGADLSGATLFRTDLTGAELGGADLSGAVAGWTVFGSNDLSAARGLDAVRHERPSVLGLDTLRTLAAAPPLDFLRGCGLSEAVIRALPQLLAAGGDVEYYSCFISYAHEDRAFARRLHDRLQELGIRCWLDEHQLLPGDDVYDTVASGIRGWDKVLLCASRASLTSWWVDNEIGIALEKEEHLSRERGGRIQALIPLNLDGYLFSHEWRDGKAAQIRRRLAADFRDWEADEDRFEEQLARVVDALRLEPRARAAPPTPRI